MNSEIITLNKQQNKWNNLPDDLKRLNQWCFSVLPDKAPLYWNNQQDKPLNASPVTGPFHSFEDVCAIARYLQNAESLECAIGFVFKQENNFAVADFDIKDKTNTDKPELFTTKEQAEFAASTVAIADSYSEISTSRRGLHLIAKYNGQFSGGVKAGNAELYTKDRYVILTGDCVSELHYTNDNGVIQPHITERKKRIVTDQTRLTNLVVEHINSNKNGGDSSTKIELIETAPTESDETILERASKAKNREKFTKLCEGKWAELGLYPSQSEADCALMKMFAFYSKSNDQVRRMFRQTELGKRKKATKDDKYLNRTLKNIRSLEAEQNDHQISIDINSIGATAQARKEAENAKKTELTNYRTNYTLESPPGFAGQLTDFFLKQSRHPVMEVAVCGVLGMLAGILGAAYSTPTKAGLNLYIVLVAVSAIGKDAIHTGISKLINAACTTNTDNFICNTQLASPEALVKYFAKHRSAVYVRPEIGHMLKGLLRANANHTNEQRFAAKITEIYSQSGEDMRISGLAYSDTTKNTEDYSCAFSMLGDTTPGTLYNAITSEVISDGFLSRQLMIEYKSGERVPANDNPIDPPEELVARLTHLMEFATWQQNNCPHQCTRYADDNVYQSQKRFEELCDLKINQAGSEESIRQIWNRSHLKMIKIASLLAVADRPENPEIEANHIQWAIDLITRSNGIFLDRLDSGEIGEGDDVREKKILDVCKKLIAGGYSTAKKKYWNAGYIERREILNNAKTTAFKNHPRGLTNSIDQTIKSLIDSGHLCDVSGEVRDKFSVGGKFYKLLNN